MPEVGRWCGIVFEISPKVIRGFTGLTVKGGSETENKEDGGVKYASFKSCNPVEVSLTVGLNAYVGCKVRNEAMALVEEAKKGSVGYFYVGNSKLLPCQLMLKEASVSEVIMPPNSNEWVSCKVALSFVQASKNDGSTQKPTSNYNNNNNNNNTTQKSGLAGIAAMATASAIKAVTTVVNNAKKTSNSTTKTQSMAAQIVKKVTKVVNTVNKPATMQIK